MQVWMNGSFRDLDEASIPVTDRGFLLGDGFFETMRAHEGKIAWLEAHMGRLDHHAELIEFPLDLLPETEEVAEIVAKLFEQIHRKDAVVRMTVSRGPGERGLLPPGSPDPTILITAEPFDPLDPNIGLTLATSQKVRRNPHSVAGSIKSTNYMDNIAAKQEVQKYGAQDALILSADGHVAETTVANLFGIIGETLWTPHEDTGILCGLARDYVLQVAEESEIEVSFEPKAPEELKEFDAVFTANALQGLRVVDRIDGYVVGVPAKTFFTDLALRVEAELCDGIVI
ncbi:aminotransferase class IV [Thalassospira tepidiphila]|uniref:Probable branched-chain-amino-acid aminotransferase n=3 Tax=Thalassospira TaxID=168934 RepID=A0A853KYA3_9PROT|nr:aminotransferase class IV [Thalassospira tepidiphila]NJB75280.1 branched-chain amino acid aminotransferase [Thalassospira tepidiphila]OAZ09282.1 4-amino-4-deoxychorismate lyase [Thalassospira tepidiphila MCCC 1A03514]BDW96117.1 2-keto-4-methylthiobutyrate aminotransferase [Thalassospira tepidiphila]